MPPVVPNVQNWARTILYSANAVLTPANLAELRSLIAAQLGTSATMRALGSRYSFSACLREEQTCFDLSQLKRIEIYPRFGSTQPSPLTPAAYTDELTTGHAFFQGGVIIDELCRELARHKLAPFTLGGSSGQTVIGATSTSTHGADFNEFPFPEYVVGLHVLNGGAKDWWIERPAPGGPRTTKAGVAQMLGIAETDFEVLVDADAFDAAIVGLGCGGIVAGALLRVRPDGILNERLYDAVPWSTVVRPRLDNQSAFTTPPGEGLDGPLGAYRYLEVLLNPYANPTTCFVTARNELPMNGQALTAPDVVRPNPNFIAFALSVGSNVRNSSAALGTLIRGARLNGKDAQGKWAYYPYSSLINVGVPAFVPVYSYEFCWPESLKTNGRDRDYLLFLDRAVSRVKKGTRYGTPFIGTIALRFSRGTSAHLGMQWSASPTTERFAHVEIAALQDFANNSNALPSQNRIFLDSLFTSAQARTARMHWGQSARQGAYHDALRFPRNADWKKEMRTLLGAHVGRFTNRFCEVAHANP